LCRRDIPLPPQGVAGFPNNHLLMSLSSTIIKDQTKGSASWPGVLQLTRPPSQKKSASHGNHRQLKLCFGQYGSYLQEFTTPIGVAVSRNGPDKYIIISDKRDSRIMIFDQRGTIKAVFPCEGDIYNIAVTTSNKLLIANANASCSLVCKYDLNGRCIAKLGSQFTHDTPNGVAVMSSGHVVVTTTEPALVYVLTESGRLTQQFKGSGLYGGLLKKPCNVAVNHRDEIIVSDCDSNCLKAFSQTGKFLYDVGLKPAQLKSPQGLCIDSNDNIIVADAGNYRVVKFNSMGKLVGVLVKETNQIDARMSGRDIKPQDVAVTDDTIVVVLKGREFAEVRVYDYTRPSVACTCM